MLLLGYFSHILLRSKLFRQIELFQQNLNIVVRATLKLCVITGWKRSEIIHEYIF